MQPKEYCPYYNGRCVRCITSAMSLPYSHCQIYRTIKRTDEKDKLKQEQIIRQSKSISVLSKILDVNFNQDTQKGDALSRMNF